MGSVEQHFQTGRSLPVVVETDHLGPVNGATGTMRRVMMVNRPRWDSFLLTLLSRSPA